MVHLKKLTIFLAGVILYCCSDNPVENVPIPNIPVSMDDGWEVASLSSVGMNPEPLGWLSNAVKTGEFGHIHSVIVVRYGKLVFEDYYETYHVNKRHALASVTKSVLSVLYGIAVDAGYFENLDDPVSDYFPEYADIFSADPDKRKITIRHLLSMSSGLEWDEWSYPYDNSLNSYYQMQQIGDWLRFVLERPLGHEPGTVFTYNSGGSMLLGSILKKAVEMPVDQWAEKYLFTPLGITSFQWDKNPDGLPITGGGLYLRPRDLAKIGSVVLNGGIWGDASIVTNTWLELSTRPLINVWPDTDYGFQWWLGKLPEPYGAGSAEDDLLYGLGYAGQYLFIIYHLNLVVVINSWNPDERQSAPVFLLYNFILPAVQSNTDL